MPLPWTLLLVSPRFGLFLEFKKGFYFVPLECGGSGGLAGGRLRGF